MLVEFILIQRQCFLLMLHQNLVQLVDGVRYQLNLLTRIWIPGGVILMISFEVSYKRLNLFTCSYKAMTFMFL